MEARNINHVLNLESTYRWLKQYSLCNEKNYSILPKIGSPKMRSKSVPRRNRCLFRYGINRSLNFDANYLRENSWSKSSNSSSDDGNNFYNKDRLSRDLFRSNKIMRELMQKNMSIKKSLNFDLTPSPEKSNSISSNSHADSINITQSSSSSSLLGEFSKLEANVSNSTANSTLESMDENQNQTPKQNRKIIKISNDETFDAKENVNKSESSCSTSSFPKDNADNTCMTQTPDLQRLKEDKLRAVNCVIIASTPRNLFQEFDQDEDNGPCTPENVMRLIPQSISSIKKSHKKEKLSYCNEEELFTQQINVSVSKKKNTTLQTMLESLKTDVSTNASCSDAYIMKSQKKNKNVKKALIYHLDDKFLDTTSGFGEDMEWKTSRKNDLSESRSNKMENAEIEGIELIDGAKSDEDSSIMHLESFDSKEKNCSNKRSFDEEHQPSLQEEPLNICGVNENEMNEDREVSIQSNTPVNKASQSFNEVTTPENSFEILDQLIPESIKKSHKKIKHENRKALFTAMFLHDNIAAGSEMTTQDTCNDQCEDIKNKTTDAALDSQNSNRSSTPENLNSSRLLLPLYKSVKKSHKKDKQIKKIYNFSKSYNYEDITNASKISNRNKSLRFKESADISESNKKRKSKDTFLESVICKSLSLESKDASDEFKIYTPIKRPSSSIFKNYEDKTSQEDSAQTTTSKEINCSRCVTPVIRIHNYSRKLGENNDLMSEECSNVEKMVTEASVLKTGPVDAINLKTKDGRSTPTHMSTTELLDNVNSIKKSHKKDKHDRSVRKALVLGKKQSFAKESRNGNVRGSIKILKDNNTRLLSKSLNVDNPMIGMRIRNILDKKQNKSYNEIMQGSPQPSTSRRSDSAEDAKSRLLNMTPPNDVSAVHLIKVFHNSIKRSHKKERDNNAQVKCILMSKEYDELSDDGSIFDEDDRLHFTESYSSRQDSNEMII